MLYKTSKEGNKPKTSCNIILLKKINYIQTSKKNTNCKQSFVIHSKLLYWWGGENHKIYSRVQKSA